MAVIRKFKLQKACNQIVTKSTTKIALLMTDLELSLHRQKKNEYKERHLRPPLFKRFSAKVRFED